MINSENARINLIQHCNLIMKKKVLLLIYSIALVFNACDKAHDSVDVSIEESNYARFIGVVDTKSSTRIAGNEWESGDAIGIYAFESKKEPPNEVFDNNENLKFITKDGNGEFESTSSNIYYPVDGALDFIAYYPYQKDIVDNKYIIDISNQENTGDIDLLYSDNAKEISNSNSAVELNFKHMLSKINIEISAGENISSLEGIKADITGMKTKGTYNLLSKEFDFETGSSDIVLPKIYKKEDKYIASAIMAPGQDLSATTITFKVAGHTVSWKPTEKKLESGNEYHYKIKLSTTGAVMIGSAVISDWNTVEEEDEIEIVVKPEKGDNNGDEEDNGNEGDGGDDDGTITEADEDELLFAGANFEGENLSFEKDKNLAVEIAKNIGVNNTTGLRIGNKWSMPSSPAFVAKIYEQIYRVEINSEYSKINFYLKGKLTSAVSIAIMSFKGTNLWGDFKYFNLGDITTSATIIPSENKNNEGSIDTNGEWVKITLDIKDFEFKVGNTYRNRFGIFLQELDTPDEYIVIDEITIE